MEVPARPLDPVALALLMMFGSLLAGLAVGALVGWRTRFEAGAAVALLALAAGGLGGAVQAARYFHHESTVVTLAASGCSERTGTESVSVHSMQRYGLVLPDGRELTLVTPEVPGPCERTASSAELRLRYPLAAARDAHRGTPVPAEIEHDPRAAQAVPWVFAAFGSFGLLGALVMLATLRSDARRRRLGPQADVPPVVSAGRAAAARWVSLTASALVLVAVIGAVFSGDGGTVSLFRLFASVAVACVGYGIGFALRGTLRLETFLILLILVLGFTSAGWSALTWG